MVRALALSGGGSKGAFTAGVVRHLLLDAGLSFELATGTSTGSLVGGPALLGEADYLVSMYTRVADEQIFNNSVVGHILTQTGALAGPLAARLTPLHKLLKDYYLDQGKLAALTATGKILEVASVNVRTNAVHYVSSKEVADGTLRPETFVRAILASCSEPVFTQPVQVYKDEAGSPFRDDLFFDGGLKEFLPVERAVARGGTDVWAVATSPIPLPSTPWGGSGNAGTSTLDALVWTIETFWAEVYRNNRHRADLCMRWQRARRTFKERLLAKGMSATEADVVLDLPAGEAPAASTLEALHVLTPRSPLPTSLQFSPAIMQGYVAEGDIVAQRHMDAGAPPYVHDPSVDPW